MLKRAAIRADYDTQRAQPHLNYNEEIAEIYPNSSDSWDSWDQVFKKLVDISRFLNISLFLK